jgi:hypothetical protein
MNIITTKPIIYSNANGDEKPVVAKERKQINPDVLKTGGEVLAGIGSALVNRQRSYTDAEQRCGKKPIGKKARESWQKCVDSGVGIVAPMQQTPTMETAPTKTPMTKNTKIALISGGVVLLTVIGYLIYKKSK